MCPFSNFIKVIHFEIQNPFQITCETGSLTGFFTESTATTYKIKHSYLILECKQRNAVAIVSLDFYTQGLDDVFLLDPLPLLACFFLISKSSM